MFDLLFFHNVLQSSFPHFQVEHGTQHKLLCCQVCRDELPKVRGVRGFRAAFAKGEHGAQRSTLVH